MEEARHEGPGGGGGGEWEKRPERELGRGADPEPVRHVDRAQRYPVPTGASPLEGRNWYYIPGGGTGITYRRMSTGRAWAARRAGVACASGFGILSLLDYSTIVLLASSLI